MIEGGCVDPILMTAIVTILALILLRRGFNQGLIAAKLGTVVIGGLFSVTFPTRSRHRRRPLVDGLKVRVSCWSIRPGATEVPPVAGTHQALGGDEAARRAAEWSYVRSGRSVR